MVNKWHVESTGQELSRKKVPEFLNTSMSKNWTSSNVIHLGVFPIIETPKPEITDLQRLEAGTRIKIDDKYLRVWNIVDRFQDISGGLSKLEQETAFLLEDETKLLESRLKELKELRIEKETAGVMLGEILIKTDLESQSKIAGAYNLVQIDPTRVIDWKASNEWISITAEDITNISNIVATHIQSCYTREKELTDALNLDINTDITIGWTE